jgi:carbonic anhydrase
MKPLLKQLFLAVAACVLFVAPALADSIKCPVGQYETKGVCTKPTPDQGLELLLEGNMNFTLFKGISHINKYSDPLIRKEVALGQHPYAIILACSDSRVPPEILFDKGLGEIFTVRVAGNIVAPHELGSIEYALEHLGANLIVVLGHERCGAVSATYDAYAYPEPAYEGNIGSLLTSIYPAVDEVLKGAPPIKPGTPADPVLAAERAAQVEECVLENIKLVSESLEAKSPIIKEFVESGKAKIVRAKYDLDPGIVTLQP